MNSPRILLIGKGQALADPNLSNLLKNNGFEVFEAYNTKEAAGLCVIHTPDLILLDFNTDSSQFIDFVKREPAISHIPLLLLIERGDEQPLLNCLSLFQCDYSIKTASPDDILFRINIALMRAKGLSQARRGVSGRLSELSLVGLIQIMEMENKTGAIKLFGDNKQGTIFFDKGQIIRAEAGDSEGETAIYKLFTWKDGNFVLEQYNAPAQRNVSSNNQGILMEGMRRIDEWERLRKGMRKIILIGTSGSGNTELINTLTGGSQILSRARLSSDSYPLEFGRIKIKDIDLLLYGVSFEEGTSVEDEVYMLLETISEEMLGYVLFIDCSRPELLGFVRYLLSSFTSHYSAPFIVAATKGNNGGSLTAEGIKKGLRLNAKVPVIVIDAKERRDASVLLSSLLDIVMERQA